MRPTTAGFLTFVACFAVASPGVEAEPQTEPEAELAAGVCEATQPTQLDGQVEAVISGLRRAERSGERPEVISLNNRGYNYGDSPQIQLDRIRAEARAARP